MSDIDKLRDLLEEAKEDQVIGFGLNDINPPIQVDDIKIYQPKYNKESWRGDKVGQFISVRPIQEEYNNKTFLGIYLGDLPQSIIVSYRPKSKELTTLTKDNPAIFVPELNKIIFGSESWWGKIKSPEHLRQITDEDIQNVWYVQALKQLQKEENEVQDSQ